MGITWRRDAASITMTITAAIIGAAVGRLRTVLPRPAGRLLRYRMVREAAAADRTHFSFGLRTPL
jgi:hypothetical protein